MNPWLNFKQSGKWLNNHKIPVVNQMSFHKKTLSNFTVVGDTTVCTTCNPTPYRA